MPGREREAVFLTTLEPDLRVLDPAEARLVPDPSPGFADGRLRMESQLRQAVPGGERIHVGHGAAMDLVPCQLDPARQAPRGGEPFACLRVGVIFLPRLASL